MNLLAIIALIAYVQDENIRNYKYLLIILGVIISLLYFKESSFLDKNYYSLRANYEKYNSFKNLSKRRLIIDFFLIFHSVLWLIIIVFIYNYLR